VPYLGDLVEAHVQAGNTDRAADLLANLQTAAERSASRWAAAVHHRNVALLHPAAPDAEEHLRASVDLLQAPIPIPFERARSQLMLGRLLRRTHRPAEARSTLLAAADGFRRLGASVWLVMATAELPATARAGLAGPQPTAALVGRLSPQQLHVCLLVAEGATNREVAAALFLSPKTVDYHLRRALSLLGIRTRVELARLIAEQQPHSLGVPAGQD
jgi:DNA-binding CsgD family transcriptional regulator